MSPYGFHFHVRGDLWPASPTRRKGKPGGYTGRSAQLWTDLGSLLPNLYLLVHEVLLIRGDVIFEWPRSNFAYQLQSIQDLFTRFSLIPVDISGCKLGLLSQCDIPMRKHWTLMTTNPWIHEILAPFYCRGANRCAKHDPCQFDDAKRSESYTDDLVRNAFIAILNRSTSESPWGNQSEAVVLHLRRPRQ